MTTEDIGREAQTCVVCGDNAVYRVQVTEHRNRAGMVVESRTTCAWTCLHHYNDVYDQVRSAMQQWGEDTPCRASS